MNDSDGLLGPIDYLVVEFPGSQFNGRVLPALTDLIAGGMVRILDLAFVAKDDSGDVLIAELEDLDDLGGLEGIGQFLSDLIAEEDLLAAGEVLEPGSSAAVLVWENTWAVPFARAVRESGGEVIASGRLAGVDVVNHLMDAG